MSVYESKVDRATSVIKSVSYKVKDNVIKHNTLTLFNADVHSTNLMKSSIECYYNQDDVYIDTVVVIGRNDDNIPESVKNCKEYDFINSNYRKGKLSHKKLHDIMRYYNSKSTLVIINDILEDIFIYDKGDKRFISQIHQLHGYDCTVVVGYSKSAYIEMTDNNINTSYRRISEKAEQFHRDLRNPNDDVLIDYNNTFMRISTYYDINYMINNLTVMDDPIYKLKRLITINLMNIDKYSEINYVSALSFPTICHFMKNKRKISGALKSNNKEEKRLGMQVASEINVFLMSIKDENFYNYRRKSYKSMGYIWRELLDYKVTEEEILELGEYMTLPKIEQLMEQIDKLNLYERNEVDVTRRITPDVFGILKQYGYSDDINRYFVNF